MAGNRSLLAARLLDVARDHVLVVAGRRLGRRRGGALGAAADRRGRVQLARDERVLGERRPGGGLVIPVSVQADRPVGEDGDRPALLLVETLIEVRNDERG